MDNFMQLHKDFSSKTIEQYRENLAETIKKSVESFVQKTSACKEEILLAFIAKYGCHPDEVVACQATNANGVTEFWIEKRGLNNE